MFQLKKPELPRMQDPQNGLRGRRCWTGEMRGNDKGGESREQNRRMVPSLSFRGYDLVVA